MKNIISYFRACYQTDNKGISLSNFFGGKVENQIILNSAELIEGKLMQYPINSEWAEEAQKKLQIYAKEKELYCAAFFLMGKTTILGKEHKVCAPLLLFPVQIIEEGDIFYLELNSELNVLNPTFIELLRAESNTKVEINEYVFHNIPDSVIGFEAIHKIAEVLGNAFPGIDISLLDQFPKLFNDKAVRKALSANNSWQVVPACGVGILKKSNSSRGILNELEELENKNDYPDSLLEIFTQNKKAKASGSSGKTTYVPANLSVAQTGVIHSSESNNTTLVVGPPGTGKSFSIAAIAIDAISKGKSVLISSKNDQALDVIANKIKGDFGFENLILQGGNRDHKRILKQRVSNLLNNIGVSRPHHASIIKLKKRIKELTNRLQELESIVQKRERKEIARGNHLYIDSQSFIEKIKGKILFWNIKREKTYWDKIKELQQTIEKRNQLIKKYVDERINANIFRSINNFRGSFQMLLIALRSRTGAKKESFFYHADFKKLLVAFPIWLVRAGDINAFLPLYKELFDLVIIDEATQCDIASAIPLVYRAKNVVIVGDPKQLRHVSFLSRSRQTYLQKACQVEDVDPFLLNYRDNSILDVVSNSIKQQQQVHFLDEHYRSLPDIIKFSNEYFYDNALKVMTHTPQTALETNISIQFCKGKKEKRGFNKIEADAIIDEVKKIMEAESGFHQSLCQAIGILSPFREQVNHLQKKVEKYFNSEQLRRHNLLVGTPYAFQGEERDVMFISFTVDEATHPSVFHYLNRADVFNVAITRARSMQKIYISSPLEVLNKKHLVTQYLSKVSSGSGIGAVADFKNVSAFEEDQFLLEVINELELLGVKEVYKNYHIAGTEIDLLFVHNGKTVSIDLVGYPGEYEAAFNFERYKMLFRIGIEIIVLPYSTWVMQNERCLQVLKASCLEK